MTKEEALDEFLKSFKISLNTSSLYSTDHPYFRKSVEDLKVKTDALLPFLSPIKIGISISSLIIEEKDYTKAALYEDIARFFHGRKVKSVVMKDGVTLEELISFMGVICLRPREILRSGGVGRLMVTSPHITVEDLDYSQFLKSGGEEVKDIWSYMLQDAVTSQDVQKVANVTDNFGSVMDKLNIADVMKDEQLRGNIQKFFAYLKENQKEKLSQCNREVLKLLLKEKELPRDVNKDDLKTFIKDFSKDDMADELLQKISTDNNFDMLNFKLFFNFLDPKEQQGVTSSLANNIEKDESLRENPHFRKKVQQLFTAPSDSVISQTLRTTFSSLLEDTPVANRVSLDRGLLTKNFRAIMLNMLDSELEQERIDIVVERLSLELEQIHKEGDWGYIKNVLEILVRKRLGDPSLDTVFSVLDKKISSFVEEVVWRGKVPAEVALCLGSLHESTDRPQYYLDKIFKEGKTSPSALGLFFKFFPGDIPLFLKNLELKNSDLDFLGGLIEGLKSVESSIALQIYRHLFGFSNDLIKLEVLKAMQSLPAIDEDFLFEILKKGSSPLKKEALQVLRKNDAARTKALEMLLLVPNTMGMNNQLVVENIAVIEAVRLREAEDMLNILAHKRLFWYWSVSRKAQSVLDKWHVRKD